MNDKWAYGLPYRTNSRLKTVRGIPFMNTTNMKNTNPFMLVVKHLAQNDSHLFYHVRTGQLIRSSSDLHHVVYGRNRGQTPVILSNARFSAVHSEAKCWDPKSLRVPVTITWRVLRLRMEETASTYGG